MADPEIPVAGPAARRPHFRPYLVHKAIAMNQLLIFITMLGGIATFGFFGVLIGPVIAALLKSSLDVYRDIYRGAEPEPNIQTPVTGEKITSQ